MPTVLCSRAKIIIIRLLVIAQRFKSVSINKYYSGEAIKWQTKAAYNCLVVGQSPWVSHKIAAAAAVAACGYIRVSALFLPMKNRTSSHSNFRF